MSLYHSQLKNLVKGFACALIVAFVPLGAQGKDYGTYNFGLQVSVAFPGNDALDTGFGAALVMEGRANDKVALRNRIEYLRFNGPEEYAWGFHGTSSLNILASMLDVIYRFDSHVKGAYLFAGIGWMFNRVDVEVTGYSVRHTESMSENNFGASAGFGFNFNRHFGAEAKYTLNKPGDWKDQSFAQVSLSIRF